MTSSLSAINYRGRRRRINLSLSRSTNWFHAADPAATSAVPISVATKRGQSSGRSLASANPAAVVNVTRSVIRGLVSSTQSLGRGKATASDDTGEVYRQFRTRPRRGCLRTLEHISAPKRTLPYGPTPDHSSSSSDESGIQALAYTRYLAYPCPWETTPCPTTQF